MTKIFFDLDGTLIDSKKRLYQLFQDLIPKSSFSFDTYWQMKRNKINHQMILAKYFPEYDFDKFNQKWMANIETEKYLKLDHLYPEIKETLASLHKQHELYVITARQSKEMTLWELNELGILPFFKEILVTENKKTKTELLSAVAHTPEDIMVGDTGHDVQTGKQAGLKTIAVSYGFLSQEVLKTYNPDKITDHLKGLN